MLRRIRERLPCCLSRGLLARHRAAGLRRSDRLTVRTSQRQKKPHARGLPAQKFPPSHEWKGFHKAAQLSTIINTISCVVNMEKSRREGESLRGGERWLFSSLFLLSPPLSSQAIKPGLPARLVRCLGVYPVSNMTRDIIEVRAALNPLSHQVKQSSSMPR